MEARASNPVHRRDDPTLTPDEQLSIETPTPMSQSSNPSITELGPIADSDTPLPERRRRLTDPDDVQQFIIEAARLMHDSHCEDVIVFDVRGQSQLTDYLLIGSGTSDRQIRSVGDEVSQLAKQKYKIERYGRDEDGPSKWLVLDFVDVVIHLFKPVTRDYYDLEMIWGDAPRIEWQRED